MNTPDIATRNPGEALQRLLQEILPLEPQGRSSFLWNIDTFLMADGELASLVQRSVINYTVRRLITTAEFKRRKCDEDDLPESRERFISELRKFLRDEMYIANKKHVEQILSLLIECVDAAAQDATNGDKNKLRRHAQENGVYCYICGEAMDFSLADVVKKTELEHSWPRSMGGLSAEFNYLASCARCNQAKKNYIDASDFHYEEICFVMDESHEEFWKTFSWHYRVAVYAKNEYKCQFCGEPASRVGTLRFARRNPNDSWHFLNIDAYCDHHLPKKHRRL